MKILVVNTGSRSIKLAFVVMQDLAPKHTRAAAYQAPEGDPAALLQQFLRNAGRPDAVVHRVVHGGSELVDSRLIDDALETRIDALGEFAPLHNPVALQWIRACRRELATPQVAVFDSAFFSTLPEAAAHYAIPQQLATEYGIRRYGFHGIAHRALWRRWCTLRPDLPAGGRLITLQLGGGCSIAALRNGKPLDTSMGFSPSEGLVMATRCGDIDPSAIVHLLRSVHMPAGDVERLINEQSGLLGLSGRSADLRELIDDPDPAARLAVEVYCRRLRKYIGAYLALLGGADGIVFGGGVGEHMPAVRERVLAGMQWCGITVDAAANRQAREGEARIGGGSVEVRVIPADETAILAEEAGRVLQGRERLPA